ncbi:MAG: hypothetical protein QM535_01005 [Limnohabitans sp.]|nr:hypothetical protein [Limnohabitans sp.]
MKKQIKKFDASQFEVLETKGEMLKGGFTTAIANNVVGGKEGGLNLGCTTNSGCNTVAGCGGTKDIQAA